MTAILEFVEKLLSFLGEGEASGIIQLIKDLFASIA